MSFELVCHNCGAPSGASVGTCPFCKSTLVQEQKGKPLSPIYKNLAKVFNSGNMDSALQMAQQIAKDSEKYGEDIPLQILCAKIFLETEGPYGILRGLLGKAYLVDSENAELTDYIEIANAKLELSSGNWPHGTQILQSVLRRSPENPHALFLLGAHLFWREKKPYEAVNFLQRCVQVRPQFQRAWACLAGIACELNQPHIAEHAIRRCIEMEKYQPMKLFFEKLLLRLKEPERKAA